MMPLRDLLKNKILLQKNHNFNEEYIDQYPYWQYEEVIKIVNEIVEEEEKNRKKEEESQKQNTPNFNPGSYMNKMGSMANKFKK